MPEVERVFILALSLDRVSPVRFSGECEGIASPYSQSLTPSESTQTCMPRPMLLSLHNGLKWRME